MSNGLLPEGFKEKGITTERAEQEGVYCEECPNLQEHLICNVLDSLSQWYDHRIKVNIENKYFFTWDFFLGESVGMVIQADGENGHGTNYSLSDDVIQCRIPYIKNILHVKAETEDEIRETIVNALNSLED